MELLELLNTVLDLCAQRGKRHPLSIVLLVIIMGTMLGDWGWGYCKGTGELRIACIG